MAARQPFTQVDVFTDRPYAGNPAAVRVLPAAHGGLVRVQLAGDRVQVGGQ